MSLTSLIKANPDVKAFLLRTMPQRITFVSSSDLPAFSTKNACAVPMGEKSRQSQIGMLTDFLFRFATAKAVHIPVCYDTALLGIAQLQRLSRFHETSGSYEQAVHYRSLAAVAQANFEKYKEILDAEDALNKETALAILFMARMEQMAHGAKIDQDFFLNISKEEMTESLQMLQLYYATFLKSDVIHSDSNVVLSPSFGTWDEKVGGATGDLYADGVLYDFKSRVGTGYHQQDVMQLWGYYLLHCLNQERLNPGENNTGSLGNRRIDNLAIYYSRYGITNSCPVIKPGKDILTEFVSLIERELGEGNI